MIKIVLVFVFLIFLSSCGSVKDGLTLKKKSNADEFLVEKKNPLVLPPDFDKLPIPNEQTMDEISDELNEVEKLISKNKDKIKKKKNNSSSNKIEQNILNKIKTK